MALCSVLAVGRYKVKAKAKSHTSSIIAILSVIVLIGLGIQLVKHVLNNRSSVAVRNTNSVEYTKAGKFTPSGNYQVIIRNDIFSPLGEQKTVMVDSPPKQIIQVEKPPPEPLNELAFTGIVYLGSEYIALVEDSSKDKAYFLRKGDKLKDYFVDTITDENVVLINGSSKFTAHVGSVVYYDSNGWLSTSEPRSNQTAAEFTESKAEERVSLNKSSDDLSIVERMKARRKKELGQE